MLKTLSQIGWALFAYWPITTVTIPLILIESNLAPNLYLLSKKIWSKKDRYAYYLSYLLLPLLVTKLFQPFWKDIFAGFYTIFGLIPNFIIFLHKKYLSTITTITLSPKEVWRSQGWHKKDDGHTYNFCAMLIFNNKYNLGARLD